MPSSSGGGGYFVKRLPDSKWSCSCPDFKFNKRKHGLECKHIKAVRADIPPQATIKARRTSCAPRQPQGCPTKLAPRQASSGRVWQARSPRPAACKPSPLSLHAFSSRPPPPPSFPPSDPAMTLALVAAHAGRPRPHQVGRQEEERAPEAQARRRRRRRRRRRGVHAPRGGRCQVRQAHHQEAQSAAYNLYATASSYYQ